MKRKKILLADDVELFRALEKSFFRREEFDLIEARTGQQALDIALAEKPDLIMMDLYMPEMDGDEACRRIKAHPEIARIPVIMVTQAGREADNARCQAAGCDDIVLKPINRAQFLEIARKHLDLIERAAPRYPARLEICYGTAAAQQPLTNYSVNVSTGGLFLETTQALEVGTPLSLCITLPDRAAPLCCNARVAWVNRAEKLLNTALPIGVGLQFVDLALDDMYLLRDFLQQLVADSAP